MDKQKGISTTLVLLIVLLVVIVGGGVVYKYYLAPGEESSSGEQGEQGEQGESQDETADWETYRNKDFGFEIRYPKDWTAVESVSPRYPYLVFVNFGPKETIQQGGFFAASVRNQTEEEYLSSLRKEFIIGSSTETTLGDRPATIYSFYRSGNQELKWKTVIAPLDNLLFEFSRGATSDYNEIFNQMLSTFHFLEGTVEEPSAGESGEQGESQDETADWETYRNKDFGFEFKYPSSWELTEVFSDLRIGGPFPEAPEQQFSPIEVKIHKELDKSYVLENYPDWPWPERASCTVKIITTSEISENFNQDFGETCDLYKTEDIKVGGEKAIKCEPGTGPAVWKAVWLLKDGKGIAFILSALSPEDCEVLFNQMLSTFHFLEGTVIDELPVPNAPTLSYLGSGPKPLVQINWNYGIADYFNVYRAENEEGPWEKIIELFPQSAHTAVDYHLPEGVSVLYYKITSVDKKGNESKYSEISSVNIK